MLHSRYHYNLEVRYVLRQGKFFDTIYGTNLDNFMIEWLRGRALQPVDNMLSFPSDEYDEELFNIIRTVKTVRGLFMRARKMLTGDHSRREVIDFLRGEAVKKKLER